MCMFDSKLTKLILSELILAKSKLKVKSFLFGYIYVKVS